MTPSPAATDPTTLRIYPGADGDFTLYDDDGISLDYLRGKATWIRLTWNDAAHTLTLQPGAPAGFTSQPVHRRFAVQLMTRPANNIKTIDYEGEEIKYRLQ